MILYRISGRAEIWKQCGILAITPIIETNLTTSKQRFKRRCSYYKKKNFKFNLKLEKVVIKDIKTPDLVKLFSSEDPSVLIQSFKAINRCTFTPEEIHV